MLYTVLRDSGDTSEQLRAIVASLSSQLKLAEDAGGARHATALISERVLAVARRKESLLRDVEDRFASLQAAHGWRDEMLPLLVADTAKPQPELAGIIAFLTKYTHGNGHPADADKTDFAHFARSLRLPWQHNALGNLRELADEVGEYWADACLSEAEKGHGHSVLRRLFDVALGTGVDKGHPKLVRAIRILSDRLADKVVEDAEERQQKDANLEASIGVAKVGHASDLADRIEKDIFAAVEEGVPQADHRLARATAICKALRQKDGERKRLEGRQRRLDAARPAQA